MRQFLQTESEIDSILEMYCQIDDLEQFSKFTNTTKSLTEKRVE